MPSAPSSLRYFTVPESLLSSVQTKITWSLSLTIWIWLGSRWISSAIALTPEIQSFYYFKFLFNIFLNSLKIKYICMKQMVSQIPNFQLRMFLIGSKIDYQKNIKTIIRQLKQNLLLEFQNSWNHVMNILLKSKNTPNKLEKILKGSLDSIPYPSPSVKIEIIGGKVYLR